MPFNLTGTRVASMYTRLASLPVPTSARFLNPHVISLTSSIKDHVRNVKRTSNKTIFIAPNSSIEVDSDSLLISKGPSQDESANIMLSTSSHSGALLGVLRETSKDGASEKKRFAEIWRGQTVESCVEVTSKHGRFCTDNFLSSLSFDPSEMALVYTAEANPPSDKDADAESDPHRRFRYTPHFGEGLPGKKRPTLFILKWSSNTNEPKAVVKALLVPPCPAGPVLLGQAVFASDTKLYATGYEYIPNGRLLGIKFCQNRPAGIYEITLPDFGLQNDGESEQITCKTFTRLTPADRSCRSPRVDVRRADSVSVPPRLFWLSNAIGGAHASCASLHALDLSLKSLAKEDDENGRPMEGNVLVDTVWEPQVSDQNGFPGLYPDHNIPPHPFLRLGPSPSDTFIVTHSTWHSRTTVLLISTTTGKVAELTPSTEEDLYSWSVMCTDGAKQMLCVRSAPNVPHEVLLGQVNEVDKTVSWSVVEKPELSEDVQTALSHIKASIHSIPTRHPTETIVLQLQPPAQQSNIKSKSTSEDDNFGTLSTPDSSTPPCVMMPHGGPHGTTTTAFSAGSAALVLQGYTLSLPNYTGSLGFGETHVRALLGQCGTLDVEDCIASVRYLVEKGITQWGRGMQFVVGGSHGGFLGAHLIGQFPDIFSAVALRNPVINAGEPGASDIPDWYFSEFGIPYFSPTSPYPAFLTPTTFEKLYTASPISHVDKVRAPVLLLIGGADERVAQTQGLAYFHALKGRGRKVDMMWFEGEGHGLEGVEAAKVVWEATLRWLKAWKDL